jgi:hypothetical protein
LVIVNVGNFRHKKRLCPFQVLSEEQNLTLTITDDTVGTYICQAETDGFSELTSRPAEVLMTGPPKINTLKVQVAS